MRHFVIGVIVGFSISIAGYFIWVKVSNADRQHWPSETNGNLVVESENSFSESVLLNEKVKTSTREQTLIDDPADVSIKDNHLQDSTMARVQKAELVALLNTMSNEELFRAKRLIEGLKIVPPEKLFLDEAVDLNWASQAESELEYSYYENSPLKDIGVLDSIVCKSRYCRVLVQIPNEIEISTATLIAWGDPRSINVKPGDDKSENHAKSKFVELYISRARLNKNQNE